MKRKKKFKDELEILQDQIHKHNTTFNYENLLNVSSLKSYKSYSWFDIYKAKYDSEATFNLPKVTPSKKLMKSRQVILLPDEDQEKILMSWLKVFRLMYNETIKMTRILKKEGDKKYISWQYLRDHKLKEIKQKYVNKYKIYVHTLDNAIHLACSNYKSALTNLKNKNIKYFTIRYIKESKPKKIFQLEKQAFSNEGFCTSIFGKTMKFKTENGEDFSYKNVKCDSTISYDTHTHRWTLYVPYYSERKIKENKTGVIGIDPGLKTFLTCISDNRIYKIGNNVIDTIKPQLEKIDKLNEVNNKKTRKRVRTIYTKIKNQITDLHWKSINYLVNRKNAGGIIIGNWSTKDTASKKSFLQPMYKRISGILSLYKFKERLKFKCDEYNIPCIISDESYTSKTCSKCASLNDKIKNRTLQCSTCNFSIDRDCNGALNILFKNIN